jgi:hypothetical protein
MWTAMAAGQALNALDPFGLCEEGIGDIGGGGGVGEGGGGPEFSPVGPSPGYGDDGGGGAGGGGGGEYVGGGGISNGPKPLRPIPDPIEPPGMNIEDGFWPVGSEMYKYWDNIFKNDPRYRIRGYTPYDDPFLGLDWDGFWDETWEGVKENWVDIALTVVPGGLILKVVRVATRGRCFFVIVCFVAGTDVLTPEGARDIETIQPGEKVWAFDGEIGGTGGWQATEVIATSKTLYDGVMVKVEITDDDGSCEVIECTEGHPFWVVGGIALANRPQAEDAVPEGAEPTAGGRWVEAGSLRVGDTLMTRDGGYVVVAGVSSQTTRRVVYNLTLASLHNYAIGDDGVLVHNGCPAKITAYSEHAIDQVIGRNGGRGVSIKGILDAIRKPVSASQQANGFWKVRGSSATVIITPRGTVITAWGKPRGPKIWSWN